MFGLELCDDDCHIVDGDGIVLGCTAVNILQARPAKGRLYILMLSEDSERDCSL